MIGGYRRGFKKELKSYPVPYSGFDIDNDGDFTDEKWIVFNDGNEPSTLLPADHVGRSGGVIKSDIQIVDV